MNLTRFQHGAYAGVAGGVAFGAMMGMMGMLPMIGQMVGAPTAAVGFIVHLAISAVIGTSFAALFQAAVTGTASGLGYGAAYGTAWWFLGPLTLMPLMMGMGLGVNWNLTAATQMAPSLLGHRIFGLILGVVYARLESCGYQAEPSSVKA